MANSGSVKPIGAKVGKFFPPAAWPRASSASFEVARRLRSVRKHFGNRLPETIIEPGRGMVGDAGMIKAEVVLISKKEKDDRYAKPGSAARPQRHGFIAATSWNRAG